MALGWIAWPWVKELKPNVSTSEVLWTLGSGQDQTCSHLKDVATRCFFQIKRSVFEVHWTDVPRLKPSLFLLCSYAFCAFVLDDVCPYAKKHMTTIIYRPHRPNNLHEPNDIH